MMIRRNAENWKRWRICCLDKIVGRSGMYIVKAEENQVEKIVDMEVSDLHLVYTF